MSRDRAAYMREYRKRKRDHAAYDAAKPEIGRIKSEASARIAELEAEVARLRRELAARPSTTTYMTPAGLVARPFTPVPKPGQKGK